MFLWFINYACFRIIHNIWSFLCSIIMYCPAWQMLGLLLIVLCSGLSAIVIKTLLLLLLLIKICDLPWLLVRRYIRWHRAGADDDVECSNRSGTDSRRQMPPPSPTCDSAQPQRPMTSPDVDAGPPRLRSSRTTRTRPRLPGPTLWTQ